MRRRNLIIAGVLILIIAFVFVLLTRINIPKIVDFSPTDNAVNFPTDGLISINFDRQLSNNEENKIQIKITPNEDLDTSWGTKQLNIASKQGFKTNIKYQIEIDYSQSKLVSFSFTTAILSSKDIKDQGKQQTGLDYNASQKLKDFITKNPWYTSLPIDNQNYTIVYDFDKNQFRIRIKANVPASQKQQFVDQALIDLKNIGVTSNPIPYYTL